MTQQSEDTSRIHDLIADMRFAMLTSTGEAGRLESRPMTPQRVEDDLTVLFITQRSTDVAQQADGRPVNVAFAQKGTFVSLSGVGEVRDDVAAKKELWDAVTGAFADGDPEDPENVILAVRADSASYWDSPSAPILAWNLLRSVASKDEGRPAGGEHGTVEV